VLVPGDSQVECGHQPPLLARRPGRPVANLAVVVGQAAATFALFERALQAGARPHAVVVDFF
jgi:hypothetical protein